MKRFYKTAECDAHEQGFRILLDGRPVRTPGGRLLVAPSLSVARAVASEWEAQRETIDPAAMPLTQLVTTTIDIVGPGRVSLTESVVAYLDTDLLCYRAAQPEELAALQAQCRDPWLDWFARTFGTGLETTEGLRALKQPQKAREAVRERIESLDDGAFTILQAVTALSGSVVLGLACVARAIDTAGICAAMTVEERHKGSLYNEAVYGPDPHQEKQQKSVVRDLDAAELYLRLMETRDDVEASL